jgi:hypothetical protein
MAVNPKQEMIWQGRFHLGDEPGIYGDANYCGLCVELPVTIYPMYPNSTTDIPFKLLIETASVETYSGYPGHRIKVIAYQEANDPAKPFHFISKILADVRLTSDDSNKKEIQVNPGILKNRLFISVQIRCDTEVTSGLYDDFIWQKLSLLTTNYEYYASFGFDYEDLSSHHELRISKRMKMG